jgi:Leucine-rich repeat (LRR) protein
MSEKKHNKNYYKKQIFQNDLKFKKYRTNVNKVMPEYFTINADDLLENGINPDIDMDTLEFRLEESKAQGYKVLDISHLDLTILPELNNKIELLFASNNKFEEMPDLRKYNLKCLDLSNNKLKKTPMISNIEEVNLSHNNIIDASSLDGLEIKRLDLSGNEIEKIPFIKNIVNLELRDNKITELKQYHTLKDLRIKNNLIKKIPTMNNLEIVDCISNQIEEIEDQPSLMELYANHNNIKIFESLMPKLKVLSLYNNPLDKIPLIFNHLTNLVVDNKDFYIPEQMIKRIKKKNIYKKIFVELEF